MIGHWPSILLYLCVFVASAALIYAGGSVQKRYIRTTLTALGLAAPVVLAGIRYGIGVDYFAYASMIDNLQAGNEMYYRAIEPLSTLIVHLSASLGGQVTMFAIFSALTIIPAYIAIRRLSPHESNYTALSYLLYLAVIFPTTLNAVRSGVAISLATLAFSYLVGAKDKHSFLKFLVTGIAACLFHASAVLPLAIGCVVLLAKSERGKSIRVNRAMLTLATILAAIFPLFGSIVSLIPLPVISNYSRFLTDLGTHFSIPLAVLLMMLVAGLSLYATKKEVSQNNRVKVLHSIVPYYIPLAIIIGWLSYYPGLSRLSFFLDPLIIILSIHAIQTIISQGYSRALKRIAVAAVVLFGLSMMVRNLNWAQILPYNTIFSEESQDESER